MLVEHATAHSQPSIYDLMLCCKPLTVQSCFACSNFNNLIANEQIYVYKLRIEMEDCEDSPKPSSVPLTLISIVM